MLNHGLKFAIQPGKKEAMKKVLIDIETAIGDIDDEEVQMKLRVESGDALKRLELPAMASEMRKFKEAVKTLGEKKETVYFTKADKSNNIVIFGKEEYIELTNEFIENGPYELVNFDPLPGMIRRTKAAINEAAKVFVKEDRLTLKLHVSNPSIPRMYTQLKTHKQGMKLRPITPNNNSPTQRLAMWLLKKFNLMKIKFETASIKNTIEFVDKIKNIKPADNEMQVSFDVDNLYTNIPMDIGLEVLRIWLIENNVNIMEVNALVSLTRLCMEESWFRFNNNYYRQQYGCSMGSSLSPFLVNLFMSHFETEMQKQGNFLRVWLRYVDDVWAIIKIVQLCFLGYVLCRYRNFLIDGTKLRYRKFNCLPIQSIITIPTLGQKYTVYVLPVKLFLQYRTVPRTVPKFAVFVYRP